MLQHGSGRLFFTETIKTKRNNMGSVKSYDNSKVSGARYTPPCPQPQRVI